MGKEEYHSAEAKHPHVQGCAFRQGRHTVLAARFTPRQQQIGGRATEHNVTFRKRELIRLWRRSFKAAERLEARNAGRIDLPLFEVGAFETLATETPMSGPF